MGYTPQLATAVMYVRGDGDDQLDGWLPSYFGADYPAETWTDVMRRDMEGLEVEEFPQPANVDGEAPIAGPRAVHAAAEPDAGRQHAAADQGAEQRTDQGADRRRRRRPRRARRRPRRRRRTPTAAAAADAADRPSSTPTAPSSAGPPTADRQPVRARPSRASRRGQTFAQRAMLAWKPLWSRGW